LRIKHVSNKIFKIFNNFFKTVKFEVIDEKVKIAFYISRIG